MVMSILLIKAKSVCSRQQTVAELRDLLHSTLDEQRDDKARIADLKKECFELSSENAALQYDILDRLQNTQTTRIPQEVVMTDHGRCYHHRSCGVVTNLLARARVTPSAAPTLISTESSFADIAKPHVWSCVSMQEVRHKFALDDY